MAYEIKYGLKQQQHLLMTPQLQQAIKLLQLSRMELEQFVAEQIAENPCLEEGQTESPEEIAAVERERERTEEQVVSDSIREATNIIDSTGADDRSDFDWDQSSKMHEHSPSSIRKQNANDEELPNYENMISRASTLQEHLMTQIGELDFNEDELTVASLLIGNIDDRGYLLVSTKELSENEHLDYEIIEDVLDTIQRLDPPGVGARDLKECLLLQIRNHHLRNGIVEKIVANHLSELETHNFTAIAKALKISHETVLENYQIISELEPVPGRQFGANEAQYVIPDVYIFKLGEEWVINLNEDGLPKLKINDFYH